MLQHTQLQNELHSHRDQWYALSALHRNLQDTKITSDAVAATLRVQRSNAHQQLTALFNTDTVPALEALTTVVAASISATAAIITALENYLAATTLWQQETAYLVQSLHSSHQALGSIAAAYGFTIPTPPTHAVANTSTSYICLTDPNSSFALQSSWETASRYHNGLVAQLEQQNSLQTYREIQLTQAIAEFENSCAALKFPTPPRNISWQATQATAEIRAADMHSSLAQLEHSLAGLNSATAANFETQLSNTDRYTRSQLLTRNYWQLAAHRETPLYIRSEAANQALAATLKDSRAATIALGFKLQQSTTLEREAVALQRALKQHPEAQLISYQRQQQQLTAQIALGELTTASHIVVLVPGMGSNVGGTANTIQAAAALRHEMQQRHRTNPAIVVWQGYDTPQLHEEPQLGKAISGARHLSADLQALQRQHPTAKISLIGHSYGSTTAAAALTQLETPVANFVAVGSAGLASDVTRQQLAATHIYATTAAPESNSWVPNGAYDNSRILHDLTQHSDLVAPLGIAFGEHRTDPRTLPGVTVLPANELQNSGKIVTGHSIFSENSRETGYFNAGSQSLQAIAAALSQSPQPAPAHNR